MRDLLEIREELDDIDKEIMRLYEERMKLCTEVAEYKINTGKKVFDKEREDAKLEALGNLASNDFNRHGVQELFAQIMAASRKLQYQMLTDKGVKGRLPFAEIESLDKEHSRVVFQGVEGAYSQAAMKAFFGEQVNAFPC